MSQNGNKLEYFTRFSINPPTLASVRAQQNYFIFNYVLLVLEGIRD